MPKPSENLRAAKALIENPKHWVKGYNAKNAEGFYRNPVDEDACRFCAQGALMRIEGAAAVITLIPLFSFQFLIEAAQELDPKKHNMSKNNRPSLFNDHPATTHAHVMVLFTVAIQKAEEWEKRKSEYEAYADRRK